LEKPRCWGGPLPIPNDCKSKVPWTSRHRTEITCPGHRYAFEAKLAEVRACRGLGGILGIEPCPSSLPVPHIGCMCRL
jgi:hypothetical protein